MTLQELKRNIDHVRQRKLSGGITCTHLNIQESGARQLIIGGDVNITIKVLDLTSHGSAQLSRLMQTTQGLISNKLNGPSGLSYDVFLHKFDAAKKVFTKDYDIYRIGYNLNYIVRLQQIRMLSELAGNDFVLAVVDAIGRKTDDSITGGLTINGGGPCSVAYNDWLKYPYIGAHEFFHALTLHDLKGAKNNTNIMSEFAGPGRTQITDQQRLYMNRYMMREINQAFNSPYSNPNLNTGVHLRNFLNDSFNGFKYNKVKFR